VEEQIIQVSGDCHQKLELLNVSGVLLAIYFQKLFALYM